MSRFRSQFAARSHSRLAAEFGEAGVTVSRLIAGEWSEEYPLPPQLLDRGEVRGLFTAGERTPGWVLLVPRADWPAELGEPREGDRITIEGAKRRVREAKPSPEAPDVWELTTVQ